MDSVRRSANAQRDRTPEAPAWARKGVPEALWALLDCLTILESRTDLLFAAKVVGAQLGAHLGNYRHYSVAVAHACRGRGSLQKH